MQAQTIKKGFATVLLLFAAGCGDSTSSVSSTASPPDDAPMLCASSSCGSATRLVGIPDAENILFTAQGRLFVTGDEAYEITRNENGFAATSIGAAGCTTPTTEFLGLAQRGNTLYAACNGAQPQLFAAALTTNPSLQPIYNFVNASFPNGIATDNQGRLYVTNGPLSPPAVILRLTFDPNDPLNVIDEEIWLDRDIESPNGIAFDGSNFFITDSSFSGQPGIVKRVILNADGSAGEVTTLFTSLGVLDDLSVVDDNRLLVGNFSEGRFSLIDKSGNLISETDMGTFIAASAVNIGQPPLFSTSDILVTDKGILFERASQAGNALFVFRADP